MDKASVGQYGVYLVAATLHREGFTAVTTSRNTEAVDILAFNAQTGKSVGIQVKTVRQKSKDMNKDWLPGFSAIPALPGAFDPPLQYPFVYVYVPEDEQFSPLFFVLPAEQVKQLVRAEWERYLKERRGSHLKPIAELESKKHPLWFRVSRALPYKDKWENLGLGLA